MLIVRLFASLLHRAQRHQGNLQLHHLAGGNTSHSHFGDDALQVAHLTEAVCQLLTQVRLAEEAVHPIQTLIDGTLILQGEGNPAAQQSSTHGADSLVNNIQQRNSPFVHGSQQLQVADGITVQTDIALLLNAGDADDMLDVAVEGDVKVVQHSPSSHDAILQMLNAKTLQVLRLEVFQQLLAGKLLGEHPVIEFKRAEFIAESPLKLLPQPPLEQYLLGREVVDQLLHVLKGALSRQEFACRDVQEGYSARPPAEMY